VLFISIPTARREIVYACAFRWRRPFHLPAACGLVQHQESPMIGVLVYQGDVA
jgi:hypothetical protein